MRAVSSGTGGSGCEESDMGGLRTIKSPNTSASPNAADFANGIRTFSGYRNAHDGRPRQCWRRDLPKLYPATTLPPNGRVDVYRRNDRAFLAASFVAAWDSGADGRPSL